MARLPCSSFSRATNEEERSMADKIDNDRFTPVGGRKSLGIYQRVPGVLHRPALSTAIVGHEAAIAGLRANRFSSNDDDPGPAAA
jgi:hypothetical protein